MQNFIKIKILFLLISSLLINGCGEPDPVVDEEANARFFDVVYQAEYTRVNKNYAWTPTVGIYQIKVVQSSETGGTFIMNYENYDEPQFVFPTCTGRLNGNIEVLSTTTPETTTGGVYDPSAPYNTNNTANEVVDLTDPTDPSKTISKIAQFYFKFDILSRSQDLLDNCRQEANRNITFYRFANGELVMVSEYRQIRMKPVLTTLN